VRTALKHKVVSQSFSDKDVQVMKRFVAEPDAFVGKSSGMSAAQIGQNPFGDYAPQSSQIQGILKGMYDAFTSDLEKDNAEEAECQKSFEEIMATKRQELATLEATLQKQETSAAAKTKKLSESQVLLDDTHAQWDADEKCFEDTKQACQTKATEWSVRTRLRTDHSVAFVWQACFVSSKHFSSASHCACVSSSNTWLSESFFVFAAAEVSCFCNVASKVASSCRLVAIISSKDF
jgi:hypothetical protein